MNFFFTAGESVSAWEKLPGEKINSPIKKNNK